MSRRNKPKHKYPSKVIASTAIGTAADLQNHSKSFTAGELMAVRAVGLHSSLDKHHYRAWSSYERPEALRGRPHHFFKGLGSIIDLGGTSASRVIGKTYRQRRALDDAHQLADDWAALDMDFRAALGE